MVVPASNSYLPPREPPCMADSSHPSVPADDPNEFDPYHKWLGIPPSEQPPNHYRLLGIELFEKDLDVIEAAANRQSTFLRQLALGPHMQASQKLLNEVATAQVCLLRAEKKSAYDKQLRGELQATASSTQADTFQEGSDSSTGGLSASAAARKPSLPERAALVLRNVKASYSRSPRKYWLAVEASGVAIVILLIALMMWPVSIDPDGPSKVRVQVDDAFRKNFDGKLVIYAIDETAYNVGQLKRGILLESGEHTLEVKVGDKPPEAGTGDESEKTSSTTLPVPTNVQTVFTRKFTVVAMEPPALRLTFVDGKISDTLLLALSNKDFEFADGPAGEVLVLKGAERESFSRVHVSDSGRHMVSSSNDGFIRLWNLEAGKSLRRFRAGRVSYALAVSPDGSSILANGDRFELRIIDLRNGKQIRSFEGHTAYPASVTFSPDGKLAASAGGQGDGSIRLWDVQTGSEVWAFVRSARSARSVRFSPDGAWVFAIVDDILVRLDAESGELDAMYDATSPFVVRADGQGVIARGVNSNYQLWHAETANEIREYKQRSSGPFVISPNGRYAASVVPDRKGPIIEVWDTESGEEVTKLTGHTSDIYSIDFFKNGKFLATASRDGTCRLWRLPQFEESPVGDPVETPSPTAPTSGDRLRQMRFVQLEADASKDGRVVAGLYSGTAKAWDSNTGRLIFKTGSHNAEHISLSQDARYLVTSSAQTIHVWDVASGRELNRISVPATAVRGLSLSPDNRLALASLRMELTGPLTPVIIDLETGAEIGRFPETSHPAVFSGDGKFVALVNELAIDLYEASTGQHLHTLMGHEAAEKGNAIISLYPSADGRMLASSGADKTLRVWSVDGHEIASMPFTGTLGRFALSPKGAFVYAINNGLKVFDVREQTSRTLFHEDTSAVTWLTIDSSAVESIHKLMTIDGGSLSVWSLPADASDAFDDADSMVAPAALDFAQWRGPMRRFKAYERDVRDIEFSRNGDSILSISGYDSHVRIWDASTHEETLAIDPGEGAVHAAAFANGEKSIMTVHANGAIVETEIATMKTSRWPQKHDLYVTSIDVSPDGKSMITTAADSRNGVGNVQLWDIESATDIWKFAKHDLGASTASFAPDGKHILVEVDGIVRLLNASDGKPARLIDGSGQSGMSVAQFASPTGDRILTADLGMFRIWNASTGLEVERFRGYSAQSPIKAAATSTDGHYVVSLMEANPNVRVWDAVNGAQVAQIDQLSNAVNCLVFAPDSRSIAFGHADGHLTVWQLPDRVTNSSTFGRPAPRTGEPSDSLHPDKPAGEVGRINLATYSGGVPSVSADGRLLAMSHASCAKVWNTHSGELLFKSPNTSVTQAIISGDGKTVAAGHRYGVDRFDVVTGDKLGSLKLTGFVTYDVSPNGEHVVAVSRPQKNGPALVELRSFESEKVVRSFVADKPGRATSVKFSPSGKLLAVIDQETIWLHDVDSGDAVATLRGHTRAVTRVAFSVDESQLTSFASDMTVRQWNLESAAELSMHRPASQYVYPSGNGTCIAIVGAGMSLLDLAHEPPIEEGKPVTKEQPKTGTLIEIPGSNLQGSRIVGIQFLPGGSHAVSTASDGMIRIWKLPAINTTE